MHVNLYRPQQNFCLRMTDICSVATCHVTEGETDSRVKSSRTGLILTEFVPPNIYIPLDNKGIIDWLLSDCTSRQPIYMRLFGDVILCGDEAVKLIWIHVSRDNVLIPLQALLFVVNRSSGTQVSFKFFQPYETAYGSRDCKLIAYYFE
jgi:hypothetical protein